NVLFEAEAFLNKPTAVFSQSPSERFIAKQLLHALAEPLMIHPRYEKSVVTVDQPFPDAAGVKRNHGQSETHGFQSHRAERFRPHRTHHRHAGVRVKLFKLSGRNVALEMNAIFEMQLTAELFAKRKMMAIADNDAFK